MNLAKYQALLSVVESGSLTAAAAQLGLTQSAVSHSINSLEEELGFAVIKRSRAGVRLTNEGERLLPAVRGLLNSAEQLNQVTASIRGLDSLVIGADGISVPRPGRIPPCSAEDVRASYTWRYSDIDINRHVNSVRYIETMLDIWPLEHYDTHRIAQLDIIYQHECLCGQTVAVAARDVAVTTHEIQQTPTSAPLQASDVELLRDGKRVCAAHIVWKEG